MPLSLYLLLSKIKMAVIGLGNERKRDAVKQERTNERTNERKKERKKCVVHRQGEEDEILGRGRKLFEIKRSRATEEEVRKGIAQVITKEATAPLPEPPPTSSIAAAIGNKSGNNEKSKMHQQSHFCFPQRHFKLLTRK